MSARTIGERFSDALARMESYADALGYVFKVERVLPDEDVPAFWRASLTHFFDGERASHGVAEHESMRCAVLELDELVQRELADLQARFDEKMRTPVAPIAEQAHQDAHAPTKRVVIPACAEHEGFHSITVEVAWICPECGGPRGEVFRTLSYDGSRRLGCDGWHNPCGHKDSYAAVRAEALLRPRRDKKAGAV